MIASALPAGIVVSVYAGAKYIDRMDTIKKGSAIVSLCTLNFFTCLSICGMTCYLELAEGFDTNIITAIFFALFFSLGFSAGYCFYVPQSLFAIEFGGQDSATVVGCSELIQVKCFR